MALKKQKNSIPLPEPGNIPARLARIVEIGEHQTKWGVRPQVYLYFSLPTRIIDAPESDFHGKQHMVRSAPLNYSSNEGSALVKDFLMVMDPKFDINQDEMRLDSFLTKPIYLTIDNKETDKGDYCNIMNTMGVPDGMPVGDLDTNPFIFDFDYPDPDVWRKYIGDYQKKKIMSAVNYHGSAVEAMVQKLEAMSAETEAPKPAQEEAPAAPKPEGVGLDIEDDIPF